MERWSSPTGRVIIIGDAAHAMPPSSGQGVNQAFEDAYSLALLFSSLTPKTNWNEALHFWHDLRQARVDAILKMVQETNISRLPKTERSLFEQEHETHSYQESQPPEDEMKWLYLPNTEDEIVAWIRAHS